MDYWASLHVRLKDFSTIFLIFINSFLFENIAFNHPNTTISRLRQNSITPKNIEHMSKDGHGGSSGSAILDTYLQFITENAFGKFKFKIQFKNVIKNIIL